jgi:hypothetical protein
MRNGVNSNKYERLVEKSYLNIDKYLGRPRMWVL